MCNKNIKNPRERTHKLVEITNFGFICTHTQKRQSREEHQWQRYNAFIDTRQHKIKSNQPSCQSNYYVDDVWGLCLFGFYFAKFIERETCKLMPFYLLLLLLTHECVTTTHRRAIDRRVKLIFLFAKVKQTDNDLKFVTTFE